MIVNVTIVEQQAGYRLLADIELGGSFFDGVRREITGQKGGQ